LHPAVKHGGDRKSDEIKRKSFPLDPSFATDAASKTGLSEAPT